MRFSKKTAHRIIISLAMVFPVAYMLGTQIATLAGAHGEELLADSSDVIVGYEEKKFAQLFQQHSVELVNASRVTYANFDNTNYGVGTYLLVWYQYYTLLSNTRNTFRHSFDGGHFVYQYASSDYNLGAGLKTWRFDFTGVHNYNFAFWAQSFDPSLEDVECYITNAMLFPLTWMYGAGNEPTTVDFLVEYPEVWYEYDAGSVESVPIYGQGSYGQELTESIFPRNNFIEQIGRNSVSENPKGFAPFGSMLRYLDLNVFRAGDTQIGLMIYGMVYWMLHVVIADLVYHMLVIIPNIIMAVCTWFGHGLDDDKGA